MLNFLLLLLLLALAAPLLPGRGGRGGRGDRAASVAGVGVAVSARLPLPNSGTDYLAVVVVGVHREARVSWRVRGDWLGEGGRGRVTIHNGGTGMRNGAHPILDW